MIIKKKITFICVLFSMMTVSSQDLYFSQFYLNSIDLNPAFAGSAIDPRIFLHYRNQWPSFGSTFVTYQGSYDQYIPKMHGGFGINIIRDNIAGGVISNTQLDIAYSYHFKASKKLNIQAGLQASFQFYNVDAKSFSTQTQPITSYSSTQPDLALGFLGITRYARYGFSIHHLNPGLIRFNYNYVLAPYKFGFYYARDFNIFNPNVIQPTVFTLTPAILVQLQSGSTYINYGANLRQGDIMAGIWMRTNLPLQFTTTIFSVGYTLGNWQFGYSYDYNIISLSNLMPVTGAHEVTIIATFPLDPKRKRYGPISCPKFIE
jgi:type IX secretion system PorP/SprF family membrane protein